MTAETERHVYRLCPCFSYDIEGIQTWLEELAAQGLMLEKDGTFFGFFIFRRTSPQRCVYRLIPVQQKQGFFTGSLEDPDGEEQEFSRQWGWEYLVRHGAFHIYRADSPCARPLHTDPEIHALALEGIKKHQRSLIISKVITVAFYCLFSRNILSFFRSGAVAGLMYLLAVFFFGLWLVCGTLVSVIRLSRYQKRLRQGDSLDHTVPWKSTAIWAVTAKLLPWVLTVVFAVSLGISLERASQRVALEDFSEEVPFAVLEELFPQWEVSRDFPMGDYNTAVHYSTALAENYEWNEQATFTDERGSYHCILRLTYHVTASEFWAKGLADDYYTDERFRYHGKRFIALEAPETDFDEVRVFSSYGVLHILIRHDNTVAHAVVSISDSNQNNQWQLWLQAMEEKLLR